MPKQVWKGSVLLAPVPAVLVSCGDGTKRNVFTVAWTGVVCSKPPRTYISVRPERYSFELLRESGTFCINLPPARLVRTVDLCGVKSGRDFDKFERFHLTAEPSSTVPCPSVGECPVTLECRVFEEKPLGSHVMFLADVTAVTVDERLLGEDGKLRLEKADLLAYSHGAYYALGRRIGSFGVSVRKKPQKR